jgi:hypothetical protein
LGRVGSRLVRALITAMLVPAFGKLSAFLLHFAQDDARCSAYVGHARSCESASDLQQNLVRGDHEDPVGRRSGVSGESMEKGVPIVGKKAYIIRVKILENSARQLKVVSKNLFRNGDEFLFDVTNYMCLALPLCVLTQILRFRLVRGIRISTDQLDKILHRIVKEDTTCRVLFPEKAAMQSKKTFTISGVV